MGEIYDLCVQSASNFFTSQSENSFSQILKDVMIDAG